MELPPQQFQLMTVTFPIMSFGILFSHSRALPTGPHSGEDLEQSGAAHPRASALPWASVTGCVWCAAGGTGWCCSGDTLCKAALPPGLTVQAWAPLVLAAHFRGGAGAGTSGRKGRGAAHQLPINSFSFIKIFEEVGGLKNQESAVSSSLLRKLLWEYYYSCWIWKVFVPALINCSH